MGSDLRVHLLVNPIMSQHSMLKGALPLTGLVVAPLAWVTAMQVSQILPYVDCANRSRSTAIAVACGIVVALVAAWLSWWRGGGFSINDGQSRLFFGSVAGLSALVLSYALGLQFLASLMLDACER